MNADASAISQEGSVASVAGLSVLLVAEGTYPYHFGGVSTWCDGLIRCLPDVPFHLLSISDHPRVTPTFTLPPNVISHGNRPVWGLRFSADGGFGARTSLSVDSASLSGEFLPAYRSFLDQVFGRDFDPDVCASALHQMHRYFVTHGFDGAIRSDEVWGLSRARLAELLAELGTEFGTDVLQPTMAEVSTVTMWLRHWLSVVSAPFPETAVVHTAMAGLCTLVAVCAKREHGAKFLSTEHGVYLREVYLAEAKSKADLLKLVRIRWAQRLTALTYTIADQISPCCDFNQRWELRIGADAAKLRTIYYGMDAEEYAPRERSADEGTVVTWVGRINPLKDVETLLRAAALVCAERPDVTFNLFGAASEEDQAYESTCRALWHDLGLEGRAVFRGFTNRPQDAFNDSDVVVLPSISEGFPNSTLEAMLCGRAVVVTSVGGLPEQIAGAGIAVEPRNPAQLAEAVGALLEDDAMRDRLGHAARARASTRFTVERLRSEHLSSYRRLVDGLGPSAAKGTPAAEASVRVVVRELSASGDGPRRSIVIDEPGSLAVLERGEIALRGEANVDGLRKLTNEIARELGQPVDLLEVTALLESRGLNDERSLDRYGIDDTFAVGQWVLSEITRRNEGREWWLRRKLATVPDRSETTELTGPSKWSGVVTLGLSALVLALIQLARISGHWTTTQALWMHLGVAVGMANANGMILAVARPTSFYMASVDGRLLRETFRFGALAWPVLAGGSLGLLIAGGSLVIHPQATSLGLMSAGFLIASALWLQLGVATLLRSATVPLMPFGVGVLSAVVVDRALSRVTRIHLGVAVLVGVLVGTAILAVTVVRKRTEFDLRPISPGPRSLAPRPTLRDATPYFLSGALASLVLLAPHLLAWTESNRDAAWKVARSQFELGVTAALIPLIGCLGLASRSLVRFWRRMPSLLDATPADRPNEVGHRVTGLVRQLRRSYLAALGGWSIVTLIAYSVLVGTGALRGLAGRGDAWWLIVCLIGGLVAAALFGVASFSAMFALSLGRPKPVVGAVSAALISLLVVGWPLARFWSWRTAVFSLVASSAVYALFAAHACRTAVYRSAQLSSTFS